MSKQYFTDEFKIEAVKQITELGYSTSEVASRLCVSAHSLYAWKKRFGKTAIQRTQEDAQAAKLKRLRQELNDLRRISTISKPTGNVVESVSLDSAVPSKNDEPRLANKPTPTKNPLQKNIIKQTPPKKHPKIERV